MEFIGSAVDGTPHPEPVSDIYLVPVVTGFLKMIGVGTKRFLQKLARIFFSIQEIKIPGLYLLQAPRLRLEILMCDKKSACGAPQIFVVNRLQFLAQLGILSSGDAVSGDPIDEGGIVVTKIIGRLEV